MSAREQILANIRGSLGRGPLPAERVAELEARIAAHAPNLIPERSRLPHDRQIELMLRMAEEAGTTFSRVASFDDVPRAVAGYLTRERLPLRIRMAPDASLDRVPWQAVPELEITRGAARDADLVGLSSSFAGVAETGTFVFLSSSERPATLNFLPDTHIVVLEAENVVGAYEEVLVKLRAASESDGAFMPRTVNFISGPSRTADIALTIVRGAHGPRRLHVVLIAT
jgi:L-lactate dehydrogenase complex protein LldG